MAKALQPFVIATFFVSFAWYLVHAAPTTWLLDSAELTATTTALGVSHPPGHPAFHLIVWSPQLLPFGTLAFRVHVACALFAAIAVALLPVWALRLGLVRTRLDAWLTLGVALTVAFSQAFLFQAIRAEVYSLNAMVCMLAGATVFRTDRPLRAEDWILAAGALGTGLLNHHYLTVFAFPAFALGLLWPGATAQPWRAFTGAVTVGATSLAGYAYLVMRGAAQVYPAWVWPVSTDSLWWLVSAQAFQKTAARALEVDPVAGLMNALSLLTESFTWPGVALAAAGFLVLGARAGARVGLCLFLMFALNLVTQILFDFDMHNPDVQGYFMVGFALAGLAMIAALTTARSALTESRVAPFALLVAAFLPVLLGVLRPSEGARTRSLRGWHDIDLFTDRLLDLPPDGLLVTGYFETGFMVWHARVQGDERPDVFHVHRSWRTYPDSDSMMLTQHPELQSLFDADASVGGLSLPSLQHWAERSGVRMEPELLSTPEELLQGVPDGLTWVLGEPALAPADYDPVTTLAAVDTMLARAMVPVDIQTYRNLLWSLYNLASHACGVGAAEYCAAVRDRGLQIAPGEPSLMQACTRCPVPGTP
ncbi:MAG: DUF2723 domain-containing protein [Myxococcales bacterium]|nr:DUF2723 domain-containing protein [Myxococcales bacterium]